ncbi:hypothetical protein MEX01_46150 [Methylorubrum extorquens]|nr:hypothetical protein MEX01_46150 [Methylorubrum extorquens]
MEYGNNFFIAGGYGAYLARLALRLPIRLGCPVIGLNWSGPGVRVELAGGGRLAARAVIVTVPMPVLQAAFRFDPPLPERTRAAIDGFLSGIYEHVVLHWPSAPFHGRDRLASVVGGRHKPPGMLTRIDGTPFHYFELDTALTRALDAAGAGPDGARRLARAVLAEHFGRAALADLAIPAVTAWRHDPWSRGSWVVVPPGHAAARATLQEPAGERIWFAGEANSRAQWGRSVRHASSARRDRSRGRAAASSQRARRPGRAPREPLPTRHARSAAEPRRSRRRPRRSRSRRARPGWARRGGRRSG